MPRLMSVALTTSQVAARAKVVTRRLGWWEDKHGRRLLNPGDLLTLCRKVQGRKPGEPLERLAEVQVMDVTRESLDTITPVEVHREGFPDMTPADFIQFFCDSHKGCTPDTVVTRIHWCYLDSSAGVVTGEIPGVSS